MFLMLKIYKSFFLTAVFITLAACSHSPQQVAEQKLLKPRYGHSAISDGKLLYNIAGSGRLGLINDIEVLDPKTGKQWQLGVTVLPRRYFGAAFDGDHSICILGGNSRGLDRRPVGRNVEKVDLLTGNVTIVTRMPETAAFVSAVSMGREIMVFGGIEYKNDGEKGVADAVAYNTVSGTWRKLTDMPVPRATRAVVHQEWVYLVGGFDGQRAVTAFERYNPKTDQYETLAPLPQKMSAHSAVVSKGKLLVFGDYDQRDLTYSYDFATKEWQQTNIGYTAARHTGAAVVGEQVFVTGGNVKSNDSFLSNIQQFKF